MKIVLIEDDSIMVSSVKLQLKVMLKSDYELTAFKRLEKAVDYLENNKCDLVISDINLLDSRGQATISKLTSKSHDYKLIIISGSFNQYEVSDTNTESYQFVAKDIDFNESISAAIQRVYN
jgi:DNA-binding NtrC family response regulator